MREREVYIVENWPFRFSPNENISLATFLSILGVGRCYFFSSLLEELAWDLGLSLNIANARVGFPPTKWETGVEKYNRYL
jgi:hypothetical protein